MRAVKLAVERVAHSAPRPGAADAAPMLIAHGLLGQGRNWASLARRFAEARPVAVADMRNHGASPWTDAMDYAAMGEDLAEAARETFGAPTILLGHSMGGKAAMAAALSGAASVAALAVVDIAPVDYRGSGRGEEHGAIIRAMRAVALTPGVRRRDVEAALEAVAPDPSLRAFLAQNLDVPAEGAPRWRPNLAALEAALDDLVGWPAALKTARHDGAALFLAGGASPYVDAEGRAAIAARFPNATLETLRGAGHWLHAERPDETVARVAAWLESVL